MKSNLAYIDEVMERAIDQEAQAPTTPDWAKSNAVKSAKKIIGGFRVYDEMAERHALDAAIEARKRIVEQFIKDRAEIREKLNKVGVTPLACCPVVAWHKICQQTELFMLSPDNESGRVCYMGGDLKQHYSEKYIDKDAPKDWKLFLKRIFPDYRQPAREIRGQYYPFATLILPDPPKEVADILCKAQRFDLKVAAVAEAIRFAEKPSEMMRSAVNPRDRWAQEQGYANYADWIKRDPIIYTEHGSAAAIIAQFGDFPIEKAVVDAAVSSDSLLPDKITAPEVTTRGLTTISPHDLYHQAMIQRLQNEADIAHMQQFPGVLQQVSASTVVMPYSEYNPLRGY